MEAVVVLAVGRLELPLAAGRPINDLTSGWGLRHCAKSR